MTTKKENGERVIFGVSAGTWVVIIIFTITMVANFVRVDAVVKGNTITLKEIKPIVEQNRTQIQLLKQQYEYIIKKQDNIDKKLEKIYQKLMEK